jgi:hypothetical protein
MIFFLGIFANGGAAGEVALSVGKPFCQTPVISRLSFGISIKN